MHSPDAARGRLQGRGTAPDRIPAGDAAPYRELRSCASCGHPHVPWLAGPGVCPHIGCDCKVWVPPNEPDAENDDEPREAKMFDLLREAYTRLMVSEGDARYIAANVELAERIAELIDVD